MVKDSLYDDAVITVKKENQASASVLQRKLGIGYMRALRIIDQLEFYKVIGPSNGIRAREILTK